MSTSLYRFLFAAALTVALGIALLFSAAPVQAQTPAPTAEPAMEAVSTAEPEVADDNDTPDLLASLDADGRFTALAAALRQTGLADTLAGAGAFTLFAPTDDAFAELGEGTLEALSTDDLAAILMNHVVMGTVTAADAMTVTEVTAAGGATLDVVTEDGDVIIGGATVTEADVTIGNATVHVIDAIFNTSNDMSDDAPDGGDSM